MTDFSKTENFLYALRNAGSKYSLDRMRRFLSAIGNPQNAYPCIHVAGTNGKGSVCAMLDSILRASGLKTGLFTSPHLVRLGERVQVNRRVMGESELIDSIARLKKVADGIFDFADQPNYPSFFEYMTCLAFDEFAKESVDCAVVEVGLGGRLDSTNILENPAVCAITSIGLDHTQILGKTISDIAAEKAGIIKEGSDVVCGFLPEEAMAVVERAAARKHATLYKAGAFYPTDAALPHTALFGLYQRRNAAVASIIAHVLARRAKEGKISGVFSNITDRSISDGLGSVVWAGRWQRISLEGGATLIIDSSHNEEGAKTLESNLKTLSEKPVIALGILGEERAHPILEVACKYAKKIILLVPDQPRALGFESLMACMPRGVKLPPVECAKVGDIYLAGNRCSAVSAGETIVSTGSIYLAGEVIAAISAQNCDNLQDRPYPPAISPKKA